MAYRWVLFWVKFSVHFIKMGAFLGRIFCTFHKDGCIFGQNFLYISVKWVHFSGKNVCTLGHKFVPEPSITSKIHREPPPRESDEGVQLKRHLTAVKKFEEPVELELADGSATPASEVPATPVRRSQHERRMPEMLKDFVL